MKDQYQVLLDKERIIETINRLFIGTDDRDWPSVRQCFAETVLFDMTSMTGGEPVTMTPQQIGDGWDQGLKDLAAIHHQTGNYIVTVHGDEADAFCYGIALHYLPNKTNQNTRTFVGSYNFRLRRVGTLWKIDRFKFNLKYIDGNKDLEAHK
jgi:hypothetical protein